MSAALWFRRCLGFCIGMCFSSLGLALITNTNLGTTPITSLPVALNALVPLSIGGYTVIVSVLFIGVEKLILGKHFSLANILQMPPVFLFGLFIDCWMDVTAQVGLLPYWERLCVLLSGIAVLAAGINLQVVSNAVVLPGEGIVLALFGFGKQKRNWLVFFLVNLVTQSGLAVWTAHTFLCHGVSGWSVLTLLPAELVIFPAEMIAYALLLRGQPRSRAAACGFLANLFSAVLGIFAVEPVWRLIQSIL